MSKDPNRKLTVAQKAAFRPQNLALYEGLLYPLSTMLIYLPATENTGTRYRLA